MKKIILHYILIIVILIFIFNLYLYFFANKLDFEYFLSPLLKMDFNNIFDRYFMLSYIFGIILPGMLNTFLVEKIKKFKFVITPLLFSISIFVFTMVAPLGDTEMIGLGNYLLLKLVFPVTLLFSLFYLIIFSLKDKIKF